MGIVNRMAHLAGKHFGTALGNKVRHDRSEAVREEKHGILEKVNDWQPETDEQWWEKSMFNEDKKKGWWD